MPDAKVIDINRNRPTEPFVQKLLSNGGVRITVLVEAKSGTHHVDHIITGEDLRGSRSSILLLTRAITNTAAEMARHVKENL
jgi:hypothetical protein